MFDGDGSASCGHSQMWDGEKCLPCPTCPLGTGLHKTCGYGRGANQSCQPCVTGSYNDGSTDGACVPCTNCSWYRREYRFRCRAVINAECGKCVDGYFDDQADALDLSRTRRCSPCPSVTSGSQIPECAGWWERRRLHVLTERQEATQGGQVERATGRPGPGVVRHAKAREGDCIGCLYARQTFIMVVQIVTLLAIITGAAVAGYFCYKSRRTTLGKCLHVNMFCKSHRPPGGEEQGRGGPEGEGQELQNYHNHCRNQQRPRLGSEEESLLSSGRSLETTFNHETEETFPRSHHNSSPLPGPSGAQPGNIDLNLDSRARGKPAHSSDNLYSSECVPKKHYPDKLKLKSKGSSIPSQTRTTCKTVCSTTQTELPPAVVHVPHQMAAPVISKRENPAEASNDIIKNRIIDETSAPDARIPVPAVTTERKADAMDDNDSRPRTSNVRVGDDDIREEAVAEGPEVSLRADDDVIPDTELDVAPSSGYPTETSTLLIRGVAPESNNLGRSHGGSRVSIRGSVTGEGQGVVSITTTSDNLSREPRGTASLSLSLRAGGDDVRGASGGAETAVVASTAYALPRPLRGPLSDVTNTRGRPGSKSPIKVKDGKMRRGSKAAILRDLETSYCGTDEQQRQDLQTDARAVATTTGSDAVAVAGNVTLAENNGNNSGNNTGYTTTGGAHSLNIHINNNFLQPPLPLDASIDLRSLFEAGSLHLDQLTGTSPAQDVQSEGPGVSDQTEALRKLRGQTRGQTQPKEVSSVLPRSCGLSAGDQQATGFPIQETVKS